MAAFIPPSAYRRRDRGTSACYLLKCYKRVPPIYASFYDTRFAAALSAALGMVCLNVSTRMTCMHVIIEPIFQTGDFFAVCVPFLLTELFFYTIMYKLKGRKFICMKKTTYAVLYDGYAAWRLQQTATGAAAKAEKEHPVRSVSLSFTGDILMEDALYNWMGKGYSFKNLF